MGGAAGGSISAGASPSVDRGAEPYLPSIAAPFPRVLALRLNGIDTILQLLWRPSGSARFVPRAGRIECRTDASSCRPKTSRSCARTSPPRFRRFEPPSPPGQGDRRHGWRTDPDHSGPSHSAWARPLAGVRRIIAVASGKGGVGRRHQCQSFLALLTWLPGGAGRRRPLRAKHPGYARRAGGREAHGLARPEDAPVEAQGLKVMSMAMLTGDDAPGVMRGPM